MNAQAVVLTTRDCDMLTSIYRYRMLTVEQLHRLHFPSLQITYRRTRLLNAAGYLLALKVPGFDEGLLTLTSKGLIVVANVLGIARAEMQWPEVKNKPHHNFFVRHFVAINDFRVSLQLACDATGVKLIDFLPDYYGKKSKSGIAMKYIKDSIRDSAFNQEHISHTPDGVFALEYNGKSALFFLEIDRGTETLSDPHKGVLKSLRFYAQYLVGGQYQRYAEDFGVPSFRAFRTLYVTTSTDRLDNMRKATTALAVPDKVKRFLWGTPMDKLTQQSLFSPIWVSMDAIDSLTYQIAKTGT